MIFVGTATKSPFILKTRARTKSMMKRLMWRERENRECDTVDFGLDSQMKVHMYGLDPKSRHAGRRGAAGT